MARSINISPLGLHNIVSSEDFLKIVYDVTKKDQEGEKVRDKHIYANPKLPLACSFLALGVYLALESRRFERTSNFFKEDNTKDESGSQKYCQHWQELFMEHEEEVQNYMRYEHANVHGVRKAQQQKQYQVKHALH